MTKELENVAHYLDNNAPQRAVLTYTLLLPPPLSLFFFLPSFPPTLLWRSAFLCVWFWGKISLGSSCWPWNLNHSSASTSECWDYRCVLSYPALTALLKIKDSLTICISIEWFLHSGGFVFFLRCWVWNPGTHTCCYACNLSHTTGFILGPRKWALPKAVVLGGWEDGGGASIYSRSVTNAGKVFCTAVITMQWIAVL